MFNEIYSWKEFYNKRNNLYYYIEENTKLLRRDDELGNTKHSKERAIFYTKDEGILQTIVDKIEELTKMFDELNWGKRKSPDIPVILKDIENINIVINPAYTSIKITRETPDKCFKISNMKTLSFFWKDDLPELFKKYKLFNVLSSVYIEYQDLLNIAGEDELQARRYTGSKYMLQVRKIGEHSSTKYRYGLMVLNTNPIINDTNKQARRSHSLIYTGEEFDCPILSPYTFYKTKNGRN